VFTIQKSPQGGSRMDRSKCPVLGIKQMDEGDIFSYWLAFFGSDHMAKEPGNHGSS
jgi:hypothetical protein